MKNVKVIIENNEVKVVGINKDGSVSKVEYTVVEVVGLKEFGKKAMEAGVRKQFEAMQQAAKQEEKPMVNVPEQNKARVKDVVYTKGEQFTNVKRYGTRAVGFNIAGKGECVIGFAKDRNAFLESFDGETKEVNRADVLRRLSKYKGNDARNIVKLIKELKPASLVADYCESCNAEVTHRVKDFSKRHFDKVLCRTCQPNDGGKAKAPEQSEGATPQVKVEDVPNIHANAANYWETTCACGESKERAYELCESCRENKWAEADSNQVSLFTGEACLECHIAEPVAYGMCQPCMDKINAELMAEAVEPTMEEKMASAMSHLTERDTCACGNEKQAAMSMCRKCRDAYYAEQDRKAMEEAMAFMNGASETSANTSEQNVAGEGAQALDADTLEGLNL